MYEVRLAAKACDFYRQADPPLARKLAGCFRQLESDPRRHPNIKRLKGKMAGRHRFRIGDYRVIYRIDEQGRKVFVLGIAHRSDAYR